MSWSSYRSMSEFYLNVYGMLGIYEFPGKKFSYIWSRALRFYFLASCSVLLSISTLIFYAIMDHRMPRNPQALIEAIVTFGVMLRYCLLLCRRKEIAREIKMCEKLWDKITVDDRRHVTIYESKLRFLLKFMLLNIVVAYAVYMAIPYLMRLTPHPSEKRSLPFVFFMEVYESPQYELIYALMWICALPLAVGLTIMDFGLPSFIILTLCGYLRYLRNKILSLKSSMNGPNKLPADIYRKNLINFIEFHQQILKLYRLIKKTMDGVILTQISETLVALAVCGSELADNNPDSAKFILPTIHLILQLFIYQGMSELLTQESVNLVKAMDFAALADDLSIKKLMIFCIMFSNKPLRLTAGKFLPLSLESFKNCVTKAYTIFAAFRRSQ